MRVGVGLSLAALGRVTQAGWADDQISAPDTGGRLFTLGASFGSGPVLRFLSVTETTISGFGDTVRNAQMTANPRIRVREATPADVEALVDIYFAAFDDNVMNQLMYPRGVSADSRRKFGEKLSPKPSAGSAAETTTKKEETFVYVAEYLPEEDSTGPGGGLSPSQSGRSTVNHARRKNGRQMTSPRQPRHGAKTVMLPSLTPLLAR